MLIRAESNFLKEIILIERYLGTSCSWFYQEANSEEGFPAFVGCYMIQWRYLGCNTFKCDLHFETREGVMLILKRTVVLWDFGIFLFITCDLFAKWVEKQNTYEKLLGTPIFLSIKVRFCIFAKKLFPCMPTKIVRHYKNGLENTKAILFS
jgi:hypothetical protein